MGIAVGCRGGNVARCGTRRQELCREMNEHAGEPRDMSSLPWDQFELDELSGVKVE